MSREARKERRLVDGQTVPRFAAQASFRFDEVRGKWIVLAPERLLLPDEHAVLILRLVDGENSVDGIIDELARRFAAPRAVIAGDVVAMLQDLADKGVIDPWAP